MRPNVSDDVVERVEEIVDAEANVPVEHLTFEQRVAFLCELVEQRDDATAVDGGGN